MSKQRVVDGVLFVVLVVCGVELRMAFQDVPNFAPVAALALFAGYFLRSAWLGLAVPLTIMAISDYRIDQYYDGRVMAVVYGSLAAPVALRGILRRQLTMDEGQVGGNLRSLAGLVGCGLASSVLFYLTTNFATWYWFSMYEHSVAGLTQCYVAALPFFRYTVASDLCFGFLFFGGYALAVSLGRMESRAAPAPSAA